MHLIGPFTQLLTFENCPPAGPLSNSALGIRENVGILVNQGKIQEIAPFQELTQHTKNITEIPFKVVGMPGLIDAHTHICFAGSRAGDYEKRLRGLTYQEIAAEGGGILDTVRQTRAASKEELTFLLLKRTKRLLEIGVTTCEVKSGYGLSVHDEIKMLETIQDVGKKQPVDLISTCLAAHVKSPESESAQAYLESIIKNLFPLLKKDHLSSRIDIFIEKGAFSVDEARFYLTEAKRQGFQICIHADQFSQGGAQLAAELHATSADHLECSTQEDFIALKKGNVIPIVLPGCSFGLGLPFPPARKILDLGLPLVIASDWNPGSAPMGNLLTQAAVLGAREKLSMAETLAAITTRAASALQLFDRGKLRVGSLADLILFATQDYRDILYHQGSLLPQSTWIGGLCEYSQS